MLCHVLQQSEMERPPPYNPVCEPQLSHIVSPASRYPAEWSLTPSVPDCSPPEYQPRFDRRSSSSLPRRPVPPIRRSTTGSPPNTSQLSGVYSTPDRRRSYNILPHRPVPPPPTQRHTGSPPPAYGQEEDSLLSQTENSFNSHSIQEPSQGIQHSHSDFPVRRQSSGSYRSNHTAAQATAQLRRIPSEVSRQSPVGVPYRCFTSGGLKEPTWIAISDLGKVLVVDASSMTANIYLQDGQKQFAFKVIGIQGGCFWMENKLALATIRGITICQLDGKILRQNTIGSVLGIKPYGFGFIGIRKQELMIYGGCEGQLLHNITSRKRQGILRKSHKFKSISDVAVNNRKDIVVLDMGSGALYVINEVGVMQLKIKLSSSHIPSGPIKDAYGITVDRQDAIIISDHGNKRVMRFSSDGQYVQCIIDFMQGTNPADAAGLFLYGVQASNSFKLYVAVSTMQSSEIRIYNN